MADSNSMSTLVAEVQKKVVGFHVLGHDNVYGCDFILNGKIVRVTRLANSYIVTDEGLVRGLEDAAAAVCRQLTNQTMEEWVQTTQR